ncbi:MAG: glycosyl transferase family protein, partial [Verrucomicrobiales bacterium]|nr:glycosyl transferase family protein [Verrucomicrobiales bacterium]
RIRDLQEGLNHLIPQIEPYLDKVELIIVNNASSDGTKGWLDDLKKKFPWINILHNEKNVGFDGNTIRCIRASTGNYIAILSDDDRYVPGAIPKILATIAERDYSLIFLNYYGYYKDVNTRSVIVAPEVDVVFEKAHEIVQQPGVGHYSGYVYAGPQAREILEKVLRIREVKGKQHADEAIQVRSGIYNEVALRLTAGNKLPALFIGRRLMAAQIRNEYDACGIPPGKGKFDEIVTGLYEFYEELAQEGLLFHEDLKVHYLTALANVPKVTIQSVPYMSRDELRVISSKVRRIFGRERRVGLWLWILEHGHFRVVRICCLMIYQLGRRLIKLKYIFRSKKVA